ncbi:MAG: hypothetical protein AB7P37_20690 [Ramlibacter sp.]
MGSVTNPPINQGGAQVIGSGDVAPFPYGQRVFGVGAYCAYIVAGVYAYTVPPGVSRLRVRVGGAGGSGAVNVQAAGRWVAHGGAGGGYAEKIFDVVAGTTYTITIGAGGVSVTRSTVGVTAGNAGGTSSFGAVCSATGGAGGTANAVSNTPPALPAGGVGVGGDINLTGGSTGTVTFHSADSNAFATGGGSAATWMGNGFASGNITSASTQAQCASGGAGIGGRSGSVNAASGTVHQLASAGGGAGGPSSPAVDGFGATIQPGGPDVYGVRPTGAGGSIPTWALPRWLGDVASAGGGAVSAAQAGANGGPGGGGGGSAFGGGAAGGAGGVFAGGGAEADFSGTTTGGPGGLGAGGGGACTAIAAATSTSGAGGDGFCVVEW